MKKLIAIIEVELITDLFGDDTLELSESKLIGLINDCFQCESIMDMTNKREKCVGVRIE